MINYISHKKSNQVINGLPKLPTADQLKEGEIAINYANGYETLSIKNSDNEIITFSSTEQIENYLDTKLGSGFTGENSSNTVTSVIEDNEKITSASLNDLNERKLDASAYTPTDLSDYYKKEETSGKTDLDTALGLKANTSDLATKANTTDLTAHTGNSTIHITADERTKWDGAATTLASHTGDSTVHITSAERTKWDNAATSSHTHANKAVLDTITAIDTELSETSNNLVVNSAITKVIVANEKISSSALNDLNDRKLDASAYTPTDLSDYYKKEETSGKTDLNTAFGLKANASDLTAHISDNIKHITSDERTKWNNAATNSHTHTNKDVLDTITAIDSELNENSKNLVINSAITTVILENEKIVSTSLNDLNDRKLDASAYTPTDLSDYYKKEETSGKTELTTAFNSKANSTDLATKANQSDLTAHTGDTTVHITSDERTKWNNAATNNHTHANKNVLDKITAIDTELSKTSNNLVVNSAITKVLIDNEKVVSAALNDLNDRKLDINYTGFTGTTLTGVTTIIEAIQKIADKLDKLPNS